MKKLREYYPHIFSLLTAIALYFIVASLNTAEKKYVVPVTFRNNPGLFQVLNSYERNVQVTLRGSRTALNRPILHSLKAYADLSSARYGTNTFPVLIDSKSIPAGISLTSVSPEKIILILNEQSTNTGKRNGLP